MAKEMNSKVSERPDALTTPLLESAPVDDDGDRGRRMDPELRTMGAMIRMLDDLESESAKARVVAWLSDRYRTNTPLSQR